MGLHDDVIVAQHGDLVARLKKPGKLIRESLTSDKCDLWHMTTGVCTEAGELLDAIKKHVIYGKSLDLNNVIEELGDLEFYLEGIRQALNLDRSDILEDNFNKLSVRYGKTYSDSGAINRADKQLEEDGA